MSTVTAEAERPMIVKVRTGYSYKEGSKIHVENEIVHTTRANYESQSWKVEVIDDGRPKMSDVKKAMEHDMISSNEDETTKEMNEIDVANRAITKRSRLVTNKSADE